MLAILLHRHPGRARVTGALLATAWNIPALLVLNVVAVRMGWWHFQSTGPTVQRVPAELWLGWAVLWGAIPILATNRLLAGGLILVAVDLALMPQGEPVVVLNDSWLIGETVALATCLTPGLLLGRWTAHREHVTARATLQVIAFAGLLMFVLPAVTFAVDGGGWATLLCGRGGNSSRECSRSHRSPLLRCRPSASSRRTVVRRYRWTRRRRL